MLDDYSMRHEKNRNPHKNKAPAIPTARAKSYELSALVLRSVEEAMELAEAHLSRRDEMNAALHEQIVRHSPLTKKVKVARGALIAEMRGSANSPKPKPVSKGAQIDSVHFFDRAEDILVHFTCNDCDSSWVAYKRSSSPLTVSCPKCFDIVTSQHLEWEPEE